jgi:hypothetical protein
MVVMVLMPANCFQPPIGISDAISKTNLYSRSGNAVEHG